MKTPLCGMLTLATIYFTAQTTTPPTGKVGINTTEPTETLDVKGKVRIQGLYSENDQTGTKLSETDDNKTFTATDVVTANANGVLGKKTFIRHNCCTDTEPPLETNRNYKQCRSKLWA